MTIRVLLGEVKLDKNEAHGIADVDVLMATFNGENFVREQIQSIVGQTFSNWRLLVSDDGSSDKTIEIVNSEIAKDARISWANHKSSHLGSYHNFLNLLRSSSASYSMFCDQDDVWNPDKIEVSLRKIQELENAFPSDPIMVFTDLEVVDENLYTIFPSFDKMGGKGTFVHLTYRAHPGVVKRTYAMEDLLKARTGITLLSEHHVDVPNQINNAKEIVENLLTAYPQKDSINAVLCAWDEPAIGAAQALQEAGRSEVLVVGVDGNEQAVQLIKSGSNLIATVAQNFEGMAKRVAEDVDNVLNGRSITKGDVYIPAVLIEK